MKYSFALVLLLSIALVGCNFSLAEDTTPPPNYVSPTPQPDLGNLYPAEAPSPEAGAELFVEKCAPCHGGDGLGNGPMAGNLPVAVPAIGLRDISSQSAPADWYKIISLGNIERGMPPFSAHPAQDRWDILAFTYGLSISQEELQQGEGLFAANCVECHGENGDAKVEADFTNQEFMSKITGNNLYQVIKNGANGMPSYADKFSDDEIWALAGFVRSLSFNITTQATVTPQATPTSVSTDSVTEEATESTDLTETALPEMVTPGPAVLQIDGTVSNGSGTSLTPNLIALLNVYDTAVGQVINTFTADIQSDGTFTFVNIPAELDKAYWISVDYQGVTYYSTAGTYDGSVTAMNFAVSVYDSSPDWKTLELDLLHIVLDFSVPGRVGVNELFSLSNKGSESVIIETDGATLPFVQVPEGVSDLSLKPGSDSAPFLPAENGIALLPNQGGQYGIIASFSLPYERGLEFVQDIPLPVSSLTLFVIDEAKIKSDLLIDGGTQEFNSTLYRLYKATDLPAGPLTFTVTAPKGTQQIFGSSQRTGLVIGVGALGILFIILGVILFLRDRARARQDELEQGDAEEEDSLGNDPDAITDAIISLDEQFRKGEISREVYDKRRSELKERLKKVL